MSSTRSSGSSRGSTSSRKVRRGSSALTTTSAAISVPSASATPVASPSRVRTRSTGASVRISAPNDSAARASTWVKPPFPPLWKAHVPNSPSCSPREWKSSTSPRALRARPDLRADDRRRGQVALEQRRLEVVVQEVGGAAGEQPHRVVQRPLVQAAQPRAQRPPAPTSSSGSSLNGSGGTVSSSGLIAWQTRSRSWLYCS